MIAFLAWLADPSTPPPPAPSEAIWLPDYLAALEQHNPEHASMLCASLPGSPIDYWVTPTIRKYGRRVSVELATERRLRGAEAAEELVRRGTET